MCRRHVSLIAGGGGLIKQQNKVLAINKKSVVGWDGEEELYVKKYIATKPIFFLILTSLIQERVDW